MSRLDQYAADIKNQVMQKCCDSPNEDEMEDAFVEYAIELLEEHNEAVNDNEIIRPASRWRATRGPKPQPAAKINAWSQSNDGAMLQLYVASYRGEGTRYDVPKSIVAEEFQLLKGFLTRALDGNTLTVSEENDAANAVDRIREMVQEIYKVQLVLVTDGAVKCTTAEYEPFVLGNIEVSYKIWDLIELNRLKPGEHSPVDLDFIDLIGAPISCITHSDPLSECKTFLAFMPASLLAHLYGEFGQKLLERNVRAFLQTKGSVNGGIQKTLKEEPQRFLAYNNGLCCTAAKIKFEKKGDSIGLIKSVSDFQIVNGGQTTASIFHALKTKIDVSQVVVQMKLTVVSNPDAIEEIVPLISKYANSQNKVASADFAANGTFHRHLEQISRSTWAPGQSNLERGFHWYYERARGSYEVERNKAPTPARRREFEVENPRDKKFTKTDLAKFEQSWMGYPHLVCQGAQKNFADYAERVDDNGTIEVTPEYFHAIVARAILFKTAEREVSQLQLGGYRANIVAYSIAWIAEKTNFSLNLDSIWRNQAISPNVSSLIRIVAKSAHQHFDKITNSGPPWKKNLGENTKKEECWKLFKEMDVEIPFDLAHEISDHPFMPFDSSTSKTSAAWDRARTGFEDSIETIKSLETILNRKWPTKMLTQPIAQIAKLSYEDLIQLKGIGRKKIEEMTKFLEAAKISSDAL